MSEPRIGNNYMVSIKSVGGVWHQELFISEKVAREYANNAYKTGSIVVELYSRIRGGWRLIKAVKEHQKVAEAKYRAYIASILPDNCEITYN